MTFKNELEERCYKIAMETLGGGIELEHNKVLTIESALLPEVASFAGPPKKEVDVLVARMKEEPSVALLISCKMFAKKAEPAHVQEWCSVVSTMNKYASETTYFGLVVSPAGFTSGCESWASAHNLGLVPPIKGRIIEFAPATVEQMFERVLRGAQRRVNLDLSDLISAPGFFDLVFRLLSDFEGHQDGGGSDRYALLPHGWASSFGELVSTTAGRRIEDIVPSADGTVIVLSDGTICRMTADRIEFGKSDDPPRPSGTPLTCSKNLTQEPCTLDFLKEKIAGLQITSAADFGSHLELGIDQRFNLGLLFDSIYLISTENPVEYNLL